MRGGVTMPEEAEGLSGKAINLMKFLLCFESYPLISELTF